jgi:hypothetical protein
VHLRGEAVTIVEAFRSGILKLCKADWASRDDRLELQTEGKFLLPWAVLVSPKMEAMGKHDRARQNVMIVTDKASDWLAWENK